MLFHAHVDCEVRLLLEFCIHSKSMQKGGSMHTVFIAYHGINHNICVTGYVIIYVEKDSGANLLF